MKKILTILVLFLTSFTFTRDGMIYHSCDNFLLNQKHYIVCYNSDYKVPNWVSYKLSKEMVLHESEKLANSFKVDTENADISPNPKDYTYSGYDRGHLVPAEDMDHSYESSNSTYLMTNVAPQVPSFNRGIWLRLENQVRDWAVEHEEIYVTSGTIFLDTSTTIANCTIYVPSYFYKIILDNRSSETKVIAFLMKNQGNPAPITSFITTVDHIELLTGYDFYSGLPDDIENNIEAYQNITDWKF